MTPWWPPFLVMTAVSVGVTGAIGVLAASTGWTVQASAWPLLATIAMWAPALGRLVAQRTVDRGFTAALPLRRAGARVLFWPVVLPLAIYGSAYSIASVFGLADWSPGGGRWVTGAQIAINVVVNLAILSVTGTFTAMGEEIGWRGYLQPRLDAAGVRYSVVLVSLAWTAFHAPLIIGAGYVATGSLWRSLIASAALDLLVAFLWAYGSYRLRSLWPAVLFHSFHNTISQWVFPRFFVGAENERWLGEAGLLPLVGYLFASVGLYLLMRHRGDSWLAVAHTALHINSGRSAGANGRLTAESTHAAESDAHDCLGRQDVSS